MSQSRNNTKKYIYQELILLLNVHIFLFILCNSYTLLFLMIRSRSYLFFLNLLFFFMIYNHDSILLFSLFFCSCIKGMSFYDYTMLLNNQDGIRVHTLLMRLHYHLNICSMCLIHLGLYHQNFQGNLSW